MPSNRINGVALASMVAGSVLLYSGITGRGILQSIQAIISGKSPSSAPQVAAIQSQSQPDSSVPAYYAGPGSGGGSVSANQELAKQIATAMGHADWTTGQQWDDWVKLWNQESGWYEKAKNPSSRAYGIPQALPASKMASAGPDWLTNPATQIKWGVGYIAGRYGSPSAAWAHEQQNNWY